MIKHRLLKYSCYLSSASMAVVVCLSPLLFLTFREMYGISYSLLGLLAVINFVTQLVIDLIFSFFSRHFNIPLTVKLIPIICIIGLVIFALAPVLFSSNVYIGLVIGTLIFSASSGLSEVLTSPVIASLPSKNPERDMSMLHSMYAFGVVGVVIISTLFLQIFGNESWWVLALLWTLPSLISSVLFIVSGVPDLNAMSEETAREEKRESIFKKPALWLSVIGIFLGGAAENTMSQWASGYLEASIGIPKALGDVFGVALFGLSLAIGRTLYARIGKNAPRVLFFGALGATVCYLTAALSPFPIVGLIGCAMTGFCTSMLWPGSLIVSSERFPFGGVVLYALMAAGGDLGSSVGPWAVGLVADTFMADEWALTLASELSLTPEQLGMKAGILVGALFPLFGILVFSLIWKSVKKEKNLQICKL